MVFLLGKGLILRSGIVIISIRSPATEVAATDLVTTRLAATGNTTGYTAVEYIDIRRGGNTFRRLGSGRNIGTFVLACAKVTGIFCPGGFGIIATTLAAGACSALGRSPVPTFVGAASARSATGSCATTRTGAGRTA